MNDRGAIIDPTGQYRYRLWRRWAMGPDGLFIMLNPSTADADNDDPTIRRCERFAKDWGMAGLQVVNLFAYRSTNPQELMRQSEAIGPDNDRHIMEAASTAGILVAAWGAHGTFRRRAQTVRTMLKDFNLQVFGLTKKRQPLHPLYLSAETPIRPWSSYSDSLKPVNDPPEETLCP